MYVYKCTLPNGKMYIGITLNFKNRKNTHLVRSKRERHPFYQALNKHRGKEKWEIIGNFSKEEALKKEKELIKKFNTIYPNGYNLTTGGEHFEVHEETKKKIGLGNKGKVRSPETRKKVSESKKGTPSWNKGKKGIYSKEILEKMRKARIGKKLTDEHKEKLKGRTPWNKGKKGVYSQEVLKKMKKAHLGKTSWNKGIPMSEKAKKKLSESRMGITPSKETRKKLSEVHKGQIPWNKGKTYEELVGSEKAEKLKKGWSEKLKGRIVSKETRKKISEGHKNKKVTNETRKKISEHSLKKWKDPKFIEKWKKSKKINKM